MATGAAVERSSLQDVVGGLLAPTDAKAPTRQRIVRGSRGARARAGQVLATSRRRCATHGGVRPRCLVLLVADGRLAEYYADEAQQHRARRGPVFEADTPTWRRPAGDGDARFVIVADVREEAECGLQEAMLDELALNRLLVERRRHREGERAARCRSARGREVGGPASSLELKLATATADSSPAVGGGRRELGAGAGAAVLRPGDAAPRRGEMAATPRRRCRSSCRATCRLRTLDSATTRA